MSFLLQVMHLLEPTNPLKKGLENRSVETTPQKSTPKSACFSILL